MFMGLKIAVAQLNPTVGDVDGNFKEILEAYEKAADAGADILVTPKLSLTGGPLESLQENPDLISAAHEKAAAFCNATRDRDTALVFGLPAFHYGNYSAAAFVCRNGTIDQKIFEGGENASFEINGYQIGLAFDFERAMQFPPALKKRTDEVLIVTDAAPFRRGLFDRRLLSVVTTGIPLVFANPVGGQDEDIFDGGSFALNAKGQRIFQLSRWKEDFGLIDVADRNAKVIPLDKTSDKMEEVWQTTVLGLRDYLRKTGFKEVVLGMSGGLDSAIVAAIAGDAIGAKNVHCYKLPSKYTSDLSNTEADKMCKIWGMPCGTIPIEDAVVAVGKVIDPALGSDKKPITDENLQARIRGMVLMGLSNNFNWLLLNTSNKSEAAVGYSTLYGDTCGGYNPLKDLYKTTIFDLARWRNAHLPEGCLGPKGEVIPETIINRPPSAELRTDQKDEDSLPAYPVLDGILKGFVEKGQGVQQIVAEGYESATVIRVWKLLKNSEFKRRQEPQGAVLSEKAFGAGYKLPMANRFVPDAGR